MNKKTLIALFLLLLPFSVLAGQEEPSNKNQKYYVEEYRVKALMIAKIGSHIEWPEKMGMNDKSCPFIIGVIGKNPFGSLLESSYSFGWEKLKDKKVEIKYISKPAEIANFHILFISSSMTGRLPEILAITGRKPILTIGDTNGFAEKGVHINICKLEGKIHFEINASTLKKSDITINPHLLRLARNVIHTEVEK